MSIMSIFRRAAKGSGEASLRSAEHPAHDLALKADLAQDDRERLELIEQALRLAPQDTHLLYARACALDLAAGKTNEAGGNVHRFGNQYPHFFDVAMRKAFKFSTPLPGDWENLFDLDPWSDKSTDLTSRMQGRLGSSKHLQLVRHCLTPAIAIVFPYGKNSSGFDVAELRNKIRFDLRWTKTPYGKVAAIYLIGENNCFKSEGILPSAISNPLSLRDGYFLLRRLSVAGDCFLVIADGEGKARRNENFAFPEPILNRLSAMRRDLEAGETTSPSSFPQAMKWYMDNTDFDSI